MFDQQIFADKYQQILTNITNNNKYLEKPTFIWTAGRVAASNQLKFMFKLNLNLYLIIFHRNLSQHLVASSAPAGRHVRCERCITASHLRSTLLFIYYIPSIQTQIIYWVFKYISLDHTSNPVYIIYCILCYILSIQITPATHCIFTVYMLYTEYASIPDICHRRRLRKNILSV